jgi:hypothetical protein
MRMQSMRVGHPSIGEISADVPFSFLLVLATKLPGPALAQSRPS